MVLDGTRYHSPYSLRGEFTTPTVCRADGSNQNSIKRSRCTPRFLQPLCVSPQSSSPPISQAWCHCYPFFPTTFTLIMFPKVALIALVVGAISVNALATPVARSPAPEPECEFPQSFSTMPHLDLTCISSNSPRTRGRAGAQRNRNPPPTATPHTPKAACFLSH